jgi:thioredoxin reductase (NADPH)
LKKGFFMEKLVIIGSGAAGLTAAIYASRSNLNPLLISGIMPGGLLTQTSDVENYPGFPEAVNGFELMMKFQEQAESFGTRIVNENVVKVEFAAAATQKLFLNSGDTVEAASVIIATGASPRWMNLESEQRLKNKGVSACATCDGAFFRNVPVVVIGGGDTAMEEALFLTNFASEITVIHRRHELRASKIMSDRALAHPKIKFAWNSVVTEVLGQNEVEGVNVQDIINNTSSVIPCKGYFAALGHVPNTQLLKDIIELNEAGYIQLRGNSSYTSMEGVFAAGDCADHVYRQAITAAGMGCKAAIDAERWLSARHSA